MDCCLWALSGREGGRAQILRPKDTQKLTRLDVLTHLSHLRCDPDNPEHHLVSPAVASIAHLLLHTLHCRHSMVLVN